MDLVRCQRGHTWTDSGQETMAVCPVCGGAPTWDEATGDTRGLTPNPEAETDLTALLPGTPPRQPDRDQRTIGVEAGAHGEQGERTPALPRAGTRQRTSAECTVGLDGNAGSAEPDEPTLEVQAAGTFKTVMEDPTGVMEADGGTRQNTIGEEPTIPAKGQAAGSKRPLVNSTKVPSTKKKHDPLRGRTAVAGYQILGELGRGGMGVVYKARQPGANRIVALKMVLHSVHASKEALARFHIEAEAIAQLQHPNIVQLYEVGHEEGCPFFSLEFIDGESLSGKIENTPQPPRAAARLVQHLAEAMHFAHQRGIIHRDLKPANILLTKDGVPKITDFGLAKRFEDSGQGQTRTGAIMGTPSYMAPEQAQGRTKHSGPAADIYSLGAILYDMLTGRPPFQGTTVLETLQQVQTLEPVPPMRLQPSLPADLQTICLKALEKDPERRYQSAGELAEDLRRFQAGEPISARPTPWHERLRKWSRRSPAVASLIAVSAVAAVSLLTVGGLWLDSARRAAEGDSRAADDRAKSAREKEELAKKNEREQIALRRVAEKNFMRAKRAVDEMLSEVGQDRLRYLPQMENVRRDLLKKAKGFYDEFIQESGGDLEIRFQAALAQQRVADILERLGDSANALKAYESAEVMLGPLARDNPSELRYQRDLAALASNHGNLLKDLRRNREAEANYRQALEARQRLYEHYEHAVEMALELAKSHNNLGNVLFVQGRSKEAESELNASLVILESTSKRNRSALVDAELARTLNNFGSLQKALGRAALAKSALDRAQTVLQQLQAKEPGVPAYRQDLASNFALLANLLRDTAAKQAENYYGQSIALRDELSKDFPSTPAYRQELAKAYADLALLLQATGKQTAADGAYEQALTLQRKLAKDFPHLPDFRKNLAASLNDRGVVLLSSGRVKEGEASLINATDMFSALAAQYPDTPEYTIELARTFGNLAAAWQQTAQPAKALDAVKRALALHAKLASSYPKTPEYQEELASNEGNLGLLLLAQSPQEAKTLFAQGVDIFAKLAKEEPANPNHRHQLAIGHGNLARALSALKESADAEEEWRQAIDIYHALVHDYPDVPGYAPELGTSYNELGILLAGAKRFADAEKAWKGGMAIQAELLAKDPDRVEYRAALGRSENNLGVLHLQAGDEERAEKQYRKAIALLEEHEPKLKATPALPGYLGELIKAHVNLANLLAARQKPAEAEKGLLRVVDLREKLIQAFPTTPSFRLDAVATLKELGDRAAQNQKHTEANALYAKAVLHLARCAALAAQDEVLAKTYADQAIALLRQAIASGFNDAELLRTNEHLQALRSRADFQQILKSLLKE